MRNPVPYHLQLGKEGLEKIRNKEKYDLILLDEELEPQNGHIIMRKLLEIRNFNTKVILLTKDNKYDYDDSYLQEGFTDYIIKSSDKEEILNNVDMRKWICVSAEKLYVTNHNNIIFFVMSDEDWATVTYNSFKEYVGNEIGKELQKSGEEDIELPEERPAQ